MITYHHGYLLEESNATTLVNSVNTVGVMGKGIALAFKKKYPWHFEPYKRMCSSGELVVGKPIILKLVDVLKINKIGSPEPMLIEQPASPDIICFPAKKHWRNPSELNWIEDGLQHIVDMRDVWYSNQYIHMAVPLFGTDNGGLDINIVLPMIKHILGDIPNMDLEIWKL